MKMAGGALMLAGAPGGANMHWKCEGRSTRCGGDALA
jgi:hypothetical protein